MKKYIVITGASSGIGAATAKAFARRGENLILIARRAELLQSLKDEIAQIAPKSDVVVFGKFRPLSGASSVRCEHDFWLQIL